MTAVEQVEWTVGDDCYYRASMYAGPASPCTVTAIDGAVLTIAKASKYGETYYVFADEITRREL